jgi:type I restriction enzyme S subunit
MSRVERLIQDQCPDGVEFVTLASVAKIVPGLTGKTKADFSDGNARYVTYKNAFSNLAVDDTAPDFVKVAEGERQNSLRLGDVVITGSSENFDEVGMSSVVVREPMEPLYLNSFCFALRFEHPTLLPEFCKYLFRGENLRKQIRKSANGVTRINLSKPRFMKTRIPVPPLEVQREIVRVLDKFTQLEAELKSELKSEQEARRAQLAYYRGTTLEDAGSTDQSVSLGDIAEFKYGFTDKAADVGTHRFLRITDITPQGKLSADGAKFISPDISASEYVVQSGDLLMARTGATYGKTMLVSSDAPAVYASFLIRIRFKDSQMLPAFYWHYAQSNAYWDQANALVSTAGQPQFNANALKRVRVPMPSLERQASIVRALDTFDALVNDIAISLPAELTARCKQYQHYRDRLLSFKELAT